MAVAMASGWNGGDKVTREGQQCWLTAICLSKDKYAIMKDSSNKGDKGERTWSSW